MENNKCECQSCSGHNSCCEQKNSFGSCGSGCRGINHHSVIRILVGIIVLMIVFFAGFKTGLFFGQVMDGGYASRGGYNKIMMSRDFDDYRQQMMMLFNRVVPVSTTTTTQ